MKQNGQWLSQVRTRSNTALVSSMPSGEPSALSTCTTRSIPPRRRSSSTCAPSTWIWYAMTSRTTSPLTASTSSPTRTPARAAGDPGATASTRAAGIRPGYGVGRITLGPCPVNLVRPTVEKVLLAEPRGFCAGVEMAIKALGVDGSGLRAACVLLPRDRAQPARRRSVPRAGRDLRRRRERQCRPERRSCSRPTAARPMSSRRPGPTAATS